MESINSFSKGQNSDQSKTILNKETYLQALNFRPLTELGSSNGSLVNIKGNECKITFPDLQPVFKLIVTEGSDTDSSNIITFIINGTTSINFSLSNTTTGFDIYSFIISQFPECYQNASTGTKTFAVAYEDNYIVIYSQPVYQDCSPVTSIPTEIVVTQTTVDGTKAVLKFVNKDASTSFTQDTADPYVSGVISSLIKPIGSTFILNDIYILTATDNPAYGPAGAVGELPPNDELKYGGTIWKLNIDDTTKQHTLTLVYSNNLDFTKYHPIPPSAITGRYESKEIQRIYWSDNYNKIRTLNVTNPQLMALNPALLNVAPRVEMTQPILSSINDGGGSLEAGCYQLSYRLSKILGSVTNFSELSNPVYLNSSSPESVAFELYDGSAGTTNKSITWTLSDLDVNYDQLEYVITYRGSAGSVPTITSTGLKTLTQNMSFEYKTPSTTGYTILLLEEFLLFNGTFTHAKTCDTKDNRLFWGNVRAPKKEIENFDSRAFRASHLDGLIKLTNDYINADFTDVDAASALPQTSDAINEYYDSTGEYSANACYIKPSTYGDPQPILGGEGLNISYEFGTEIFILDSDAAIDSGNQDWDLYTGHAGSPYRENPAVSTAPTNTYYTYPQGSSYPSMKQPARTSLLRGFQHEEIYRFGIQFFDKEYNPYFTKWIGDIKMPSYGDYNSNPGGAVTDFRLSYETIGTNALIGQILYIKFDVNVTSIQDIIGGWQIVRVKRDSNNKTIVGVGMVNPLMSTNNLGTGSASLPAGWASQRNAYGPLAPGTGPFLYYKPFPSQETVETLNLEVDDGILNPGYSQFKTFDCWDIDTGLVPSYSPGDKLLIRSQLKSINYRDSSGGYRQFGNTRTYGSGAFALPGTTSNINDTSVNTAVPFVGKTNCDVAPLPFFIMKMIDNQSYCDYTDFVGSNIHNYTVNHSEYLTGNGSTTYGGTTIYNQGLDSPVSPESAGANTCGGKRTLFTVIGPDETNTYNSLYTSLSPYDCTSTSIPFNKLLALYYKPNNSLYGGATYVSRTDNIYIPCGEYMPVIYNNLPILPNIDSNYKTFGGDVFTTSYAMMKTFKTLNGDGPEYIIYLYDSSGVAAPPYIETKKAQFSTSFFFPCTSSYNSELRLGRNVNKSLKGAAINLGASGYEEDEYWYNDFNNAENDTKTYFPKPLNFQTSDEWINRIYWSELKFNNETQDSWSEYLTNNFYDVEGNYGGINALVSLKDSMYYLQERGVGSLMINPVSLINDSLGQSVKLGGSAPNSPVIQKHYYKAIDAGTFHQWSVYRSQSAITFVDARHKKIYLFDGEAVTPISDLKGQRNFVIKRLHNELLKFDNPVINKGILATYDYYHNEFLYTFNNVLTEDTTNNENLTLAYSELLNAFTGLYSFTPNLYINSNKYLISTKNSSVAPYYPSNKLWFHNYGAYGSFYGTTYPSTLKLLVNDNPLNTKVFDNMTIMSEAVNDNVEWNDDLNVYPGSPTNPLYPDDINIKDSTFQEVRCYNQYQNTDFVTLTPGTNIKKVEQGFNLQLPRNKFDYDTYNPSTYSIFDSSKLTKSTFGERLRDKWLITDFKYSNSAGLRFIIHNIKTLLRISDR